MRFTRGPQLPSLLIGFLVAAIVLPPLTSGAGTDDHLVVSRNPNRGAAVSLQGQALTGTVHIFLATSVSDFSEVRFYLDDPAETGRPRQIERIAPYDFAGGDKSLARPTDLSTLAAGSHMITAVMVLTDGSTKEVSADFTVASVTPIPVPTQSPSPVPSGPNPSPSPSPTPAPSPNHSPSPSPSPGLSPSPSPTPPPSTCGGIQIREGAGLQQAIDSNPTGTRFCLSGFISLAAPIRPKAGNQFIGPAVIKAQGYVEQGFSVHGIPNVVFERLDMSGFELRGIEAGPYNTITNSYLHHNGRNGLGCGDCNYLRVYNNEIAYNGSDEHLGNGAAGMKSVADFVTVRGNSIHDNNGNGIWFDVDARNQLIEQNTVYNNTRKGIFIEISDGAVIRYNSVTRNNCAVSLYGCQPRNDASGGIATNSSRNVEIYGNVLGGNALAGINFRDDFRAYAPPFNIRVHHNVLNGDMISNCHSEWDVVCRDNG
jgi:parallel beta-helix repeat protein